MVFGRHDVALAIIAWLNISMQDISDKYTQREKQTATDIQSRTDTQKDRDRQKAIRTDMQAGKHAHSRTDRHTHGKTDDGQIESKTHRL